MLAGMRTPVAALVGHCHRDLIAPSSTGLQVSGHRAEISAHVGPVEVAAGAGSPKRSARQGDLGQTARFIGVRTVGPCQTMRKLLAANRGHDRGHHI